MGLASSSSNNESITSRKSLGLRHKPICQQPNGNKITEIKYTEKQYRHYTVEREEKQSQN